MSMTQENINRLISVLDGIHTNLESQSTQIKSLAELLRTLAQSSTGQAPQELAEKEGINRDLGNETAVSQVAKARSAEDSTSCATADIPARASREEDKPEPPTPPTMFYLAGIKTQYALGQLPMVYQLQEKTASLARGEEWAYWRPIFDGHKLLAGQGQPDFVPEWEICYDNGQAYHIDEHKRRHPLPGAPGPGQQPSSGTIELLVPYSCSPPPTNYNGYFPQKGFGEVTRRVREVLAAVWNLRNEMSGSLNGLLPEAMRKESA
ncbi:hypothetical protein B0T09DRAFT_310571 [Sordaria sp. MPI-SDFR-AT-0083]|nr:hypothetical protein B0T09DRAFT_310571 [Sordaria sp. MPI-SDFR-AT-0083]